MLGVLGATILVFAVAITCWPERFRVGKQTAETIGGGLFVLGLVLIGVGLSSYFR